MPKERHNYADKFFMRSDNQSLSSNIKYLIDILSMDIANLNGIAIINLSILETILHQLPPDIITKILESLNQEVQCPDVSNPEFRTWVIKTRTLKKISQSALARKIDIRPEQINRFEKGKFPLNEDHLTKIKNVLLS